MSAADAPASGPKRKRRRIGGQRAPADVAPDTPLAEPEHLQNFEEFRATLAYFFTLFKRNFTPALEEAARRQWEQLQTDDMQVHEDGQNNPLVELCIASSFAQALCAGLADEDGALPVLQVPQTSEQLTSWKSRARRLGRTGVMGIAVALSEAASHLETLRETVEWHLATGGRSTSGPLQIIVLGASARYEYVAHHGSPHVDWSDAKGVSRQLAEALGSVLVPVLDDRHAKVLLCGRDVPAELDNHKDEVMDGQVLVEHRCHYLHDIIEADKSEALLSGSLFVALHGGLGLDHPELSVTWPPTLQRLADHAPTWLAVTSFNNVEHEAAENLLKREWPSGVHIDRSGPNPFGSLAGQDEIGPFDGSQGKRNYCLLCARFNPPLPEASEALFG